MSDRRLWQDPMPEIENIGSPTERSRNPGHGRAQRVAASYKRQRIEVTLQRDIWRNAIRCPGEVHGGIEAHSIRTRSLGKICQM